MQNSSKYASNQSSVKKRMSRYCWRKEQNCDREIKKRWKNESKINLKTMKEKKWKNGREKRMEKQWERKRNEENNERENVVKKAVREKWKNNERKNGKK